MSKCAPKYVKDLRHHFKWRDRPPIHPKIIVLHSTESGPGSGAGVTNYLATSSTQADCHFVVDSDGSVYALVPYGRKAWHVAGYNSAAIGIEQVGRAAQASWPDAQINRVAKLLAYLSYHTGIPLRDARGGARFWLGSYKGGRGVVEHGSLGVLGGGHADPGKNYPFRKVLRRARKYKRSCYGGVRKTA